jgi:hypothetical protein
MKVRELDSKTNDELRQLADESFARMEDRGTEEATTHLLTAQFYVSILNARRDDRVARRDLILEFVVIGLITLEIIFGLYEGNQQAGILGDMKTSTAATAKALQDQGVILGKMNDNSLATVAAFQKLQASQDASVLAQKQNLATSKDTLKSIGRMNTALEQQLNLTFSVAISVLADNYAKRLTIGNLSKTAIYIFGAKYDDEPPAQFTDERFLPPGGSYAFFVDSVFKSATELVPKGTQRNVPLDLYLESADGKQYVAHGFLTEKWEGDVMKIYTTTTSVKPENWPAGLKK